MTPIRLTAIALACAFAAHADFSYTVTRKGGSGGDAATRHSYKGQKMKTENASIATIFDFGAQTVTTIDHRKRTYSVRQFGEFAQAAKNAGAEPKIGVRQTGQKKNIDGFNCNEAVLTVETNAPQPGGAASQMSVEMDMWLSSDVPGAQELRAFYQRNLEKFPWQAMTPGGDAMQRAMSDMQRKVAELGGVPVLEIIRVKGAMSPQAGRGMEQARAQLEAMRKQGGQQAQAAEQALARMGAAGGAAGPMSEITLESGSFSTAAIADSVFAIPAGYQRK